MPQEPIVKVPNLTQRHKQFLKALYENEQGLTDAELELSLGINTSNARGRRRELVQNGLVQNTNTKRKGPSDKSFTVWKLTAKGRTKARRLK